MNLRLQPSLKAAAEAAAEEDSRSLTSLIEKILKDYLRANGFLK
ncbi:MAG TPA: toxin-antitoxin system HicB family antitoxin [Beijerinckiaceae bacterium]